MPSSNITSSFKVLYFSLPGSSSGRPPEHFVYTFLTYMWRSPSCVRLYVTPWTWAHQAPLSMEFSRQEYWNGLPFQFPRWYSQPQNRTDVSCIGWQILHHLATWGVSPSLLADSLLSEPPNLDSVLKSSDITLLTKVCRVKAMVFPVVVYGCESWTIKKAECRRIDAF